MDHPHNSCQLQKDSKLHHPVILNIPVLSIAPGSPRPTILLITEDVLHLLPFYLFPPFMEATSWVKSSNIDIYIRTLYIFSYQCENMKSGTNWLYNGLHPGIKIISLIQQSHAYSCKPHLIYTFMYWMIVVVPLIFQLCEHKTLLECPKAFGASNYIDSNPQSKLKMKTVYLPF